MALEHLDGIAGRVVARVLWKLQGPKRVITASLCRHPAGHELCVHFEDSLDDLLETRFERFDVGALDERAQQMKELLMSRGWTELH